VIDNEVSTSKAFGFALDEMKDKESDILYLLNVYSSWDYLNEEKNSGLLSLDSYRNLCRSENVGRFVAKQIESSNPNLEIFNYSQNNLLS